MMATVLTMIDGKIVKEDAEEHFQRIEREKEAARVLKMHVDNMRAMSQQYMRDDYLAAVERREGADAVARLREALERVAGY